MRCFGPKILFYAIWNKGFLDHAHLTDGMQWQKKSKKHTVAYGEHFLEVCSSTIFAAACSHLLNKCVEVLESLMQIREPTSSTFSSSLICYLIYLILVSAF